jgi:hypothetical protein
MPATQNPLESGLDAESQFVWGETREDFAALQREYFARFQPRTPEERFTLAERSYKEAFAELQRLQCARAPLAPSPQTAPQPQPAKADSPELASFLHLTDSAPRGAGPSGPPPPFRAASLATRL